MSPGSAARYRCTLIARSRAASSSESCALVRRSASDQPPRSALKLDAACRVTVPGQCRRRVPEDATKKPLSVLERKPWRSRSSSNDSQVAASIYQRRGACASVTRKPSISRYSARTRATSDSGCSSRRGLLDDQLVLDTERSGHLTRAQTRDCLVGLAVQDAEQGDCSALHDDVKRIVAKRLHPWETPKTYRVKAVVERVPMAPQHASAGRVPRQKRIAVDCVIGLPPQFIVVLRNRQLFNLVKDLIDAGRAPRRPRRVGFERPVVCIAHQGDCSLV